MTHVEHTISPSGAGAWRSSLAGVVWRNRHGGAGVVEQASAPQAAPAGLHSLKVRCRGEKGACRSLRTVTVLTAQDSVVDSGKQQHTGAKEGLWFEGAPVSRLGT